MIISAIRLKNWRNFRHVDVSLRDRMFIIGPNASGKSNFLDAFRFLRDISSPQGGGIQKAVTARGGLSKVRCLSARRDPEISIEIDLSTSVDELPAWTYALGIRQETRGFRQPIVSKEIVLRDGEEVLRRPNKSDENDPIRLTQTFLEQVNENSQFRDISRFLDSITYLHLVPQLLRYADSFQGKQLETDPFGQGLLERIAATPQKTQMSRLAKIEKALKIAVPNLEQLKFDRDPVSGRPHLIALYSHWRPNAGWQREDQFSDGTLRLIGLLWSLLEGDSLLLLEEPELSLHSAIVAKLAPLIYRMQKQRRRQVLISTHSPELLSDPGIDGREVILLSPDAESTRVSLASDVSDIAKLLRAGFTAGEAALPRARPHQIDLFDAVE